MYDSVESVEGPHLDVLQVCSKPSALGLDTSVNQIIRQQCRCERLMQAYDSTHLKYLHCAVQLNLRR